MAIAVTCPGCSAKMKAPDTAAGKKVKCPKCGDPITVPQPQADFEVVEDEPAPAKKPAFGSGSKPKVTAVAEVDDEDERATKPKAKAKVVAEEDDEDEKPKKKAAQVDEDDEDDEKPKKKAKAVAEDDESEEDEKPKKKAAAVADEDDEKPRKKKRSEDEDDEDYRPKKKKKKRSDNYDGDEDEKGGVSASRHIIGAVVLVILLGIAGAVYYFKFANKDDDEKKSEIPPPPGGQPQIPPPPGGLNPKLPGPGPEPKRPTGPKLRDIPKNGGDVTLSPDGKLVLFRTKLGADVAVGVWDAQSGEISTVIGGPGLGDDKFCVSPDGTQAAVLSCFNRSITLWELPAGRMVKTVKLAERKGEMAGLQQFLTYTPDGKSLVTVFENAIRRIDVQSGAEQVLVSDVDMRAVAYAPGANVLAEVTRGGKDRGPDIRIFDLNRGGNPKVIPIPGDNTAGVYVIGISSDGATVAVGHPARTRNKIPRGVDVYDVATGQRKAEIPFMVDKPYGEVGGVVLSPDGTRILVWGSAGQFDNRPHTRIQADAKGNLVRAIEENDTSITEFSAFAKDGKTIAYRTESGGIRIYDSETGAIRKP